LNFLLQPKPSRRFGRAFSDRLLGAACLDRTKANNGLTRAYRPRLLVSRRAGVEYSNKDPQHLDKGDSNDR